MQSQYRAMHYSASRGKNKKIYIAPGMGKITKMRPVRLRLVRLGLRVISTFTLPQ